MSWATPLQMKDALHYANEHKTKYTKEICPSLTGGAPILGPSPFKPNGLEINPDPFQPNGVEIKGSCDRSNK